MGMVFANMSMSLDGFVAGPNVSVANGWEMAASASTTGRPPANPARKPRGSHARPH